MIIDGSSAQDDLEWELIGDDIEGVIVKLTEGQTFESPTWRSHSESVSRLGLHLGAYHYACPGRPVPTDAEAEAQHFCAYVRSLEEDGIEQSILPVLDIEDGRDGDHGDLSDAEIYQWTLAWCEETIRLLGIPRCMVYCNHSYLHTLIRGAQASADGGARLVEISELWIAGSDAEIRSGLWESASLHQYGKVRPDWNGGHEVDANRVLHGLDRILIPREHPEVNPIDRVRAMIPLLEISLRLARSIVEGSK